MLNIKPLSQRDSKWANVLLGFNTNPQYNIGEYGCLLVCLCCIYNYAENKNITPDVMNSKLKTINGFSNGGYYIWGSFTKLFGVKEKVTTTPTKLTNAQIKEIQTALDKGYPVMCGIDADPLDADYDMHFVLLTDYKKEDFTIADPWTGTLRPLKDYLFATKPTARNTIEQYIIYEVKNSTEGNVGTSDSVINDLNNKIANLQTLLEQEEDISASLRKDILLKNDKIRNIVKELESLLS